jgi:hypothetical protein
MGLAVLLSPEFLLICYARMQAYSTSAVSQILNALIWNVELEASQQSIRNTETEVIPLSAVVRTIC